MSNAIQASKSHGKLLRFIIADARVWYALDQPRFGLRTRFLVVTGASDRLAVIIINKGGCLEEGERHSHVDLPRLEKADCNIGRRYDANLKLTDLRPAGQNVRAVDCGQMRVTFKADTRGEHRGIFTRGDDLGNHAEHG